MPSLVKTPNLSIPSRSQYIVISFQLDGCKDFNERRKIRAAIRELGRKPADGRQNGETRRGYSSSRSSYQVSVGKKKFFN